MKWGDRLRLAWRALRGGAPESIAQNGVYNWHRPAHACTGWDALISDETILVQQLRRAERERDDALDELDRHIDDVRRRAEDFEMVAALVEDDDRSQELDHLVEQLRAHADAWEFYKENQL